MRYKKGTEGSRRSKLLRKFSNPKLRVGIFVLVLAVIGGGIVVFTRAGVGSFSKEAEQSTLSGSVKQINAINASDGKYIQFGNSNKECAASDFENNVVITNGGSYSGKCWQTVDGSTPAVKIKTAEPVTITNSIIKGNFILIKDDVAKINLTVTNTKFLGDEPSGQVNSRRAIRLDKQAAFLKVENNYIQNTSGIKITGFTIPATTQDTIVIKNNRVKNITNQKITANNPCPDLTGGSSAAGTTALEGATTAATTTSGTDHLVQFVQLGQINPIPGVEIAWNEVINEYGNSRVEDNINLYKTGGKGSAEKELIRIHDNFIWGAYPMPGDTCYRGGGIIAGDSGRDLNIGYVHITNNQVIGTTNYGVSIACGKNNQANNNTVLSSGRKPNGDIIPQANVGLSGISALSWNGRCDEGNYANNVFSNNTAGWMGANNNTLARRDISSPCTNPSNPKYRLCATFNGTKSFTANTQEAITYQMEVNEKTKWDQKIRDNNKTIGIPG